MSITRNLKPQIIHLRTVEKKSYREIEKILDCARGTVAYHCRKAKLDDIGKKKQPLLESQKIAIAEYCKTHSLVQARDAFNLSISTINNYKNYTPVTQSLDPNENQTD